MTRVSSLFWLLVLLMVIGGCSTGPMRFSKVGGTKEEIQREAAACTYDAKTKTAGSVFLGSDLRDLIYDCMRGKGFTVLPQ